MSKIIAVDFDGTLCENQYPDIGRPKYNVISALKHEKALGSYVILWTCRRDDTLQKALNWCNAHGIYFDAVNANLPDVIDCYGGDTRKVIADEYWDDKSVNIYNL